MGKLVYVATGLAFASMVISLNAIILPYWFYSDTSFPWGSSRIYYGLWTTCNQSETLGQMEPAVCSTIVTDNGLNHIAAARALELVGLFFVAAAVATEFVNVMLMYRRTTFMGVAGGVAVAAGIFMIVGAIIFGARTQGLYATGATLHAGFTLAMFAGVIALVAGILFLMASRSD